SGSGELEFDEFLTLTARYLVDEDSEAIQEELREAFRMYDKDGKGYINVADLREILRALDDKLTEDELDEMIAEIDTDGSGTVDFEGNIGTFFELSEIVSKEDKISKTCFLNSGNCETIRRIKITRSSFSMFVMVSVHIFRIRESKE
ncbi:unnamed protein product, partial [Larinioides sclopetarius]